MKRYSAEAEIESNVQESVFPKEMVEDLKGLLFVGKLQEEHEFAGHRFLMHTLTEGEILRVGQLCQPYKGTSVELNARRLYTIAASIESVDGEPMLKSYKPEPDPIYEKGEEVKMWYPATIAYLYSKYIDMETSATEVANALKK